MILIPSLSSCSHHRHHFLFSYKSSWTPCSPFRTTVLIMLPIPPSEFNSTSFYKVPLPNNRNSSLQPQNLFAGGGDCIGFFWGGQQRQHQNDVTMRSCGSACGGSGGDCLWKILRWNSTEAISEWYQNFVVRRGLYCRGRAKPQLNQLIEKLWCVLYLLIYIYISVCPAVVGVRIRYLLTTFMLVVFSLVYHLLASIISCGEFGDHWHKCPKK